MGDKKMSRRQIIKAGSMAAMSAVALPLKANTVNPSNFFTQKIFSISSADTDICFMKAVDMAALLRSKKISAREIMQAHLKQIEKINGKVNAIITHVPE